MKRSLAITLLILLATKVNTQAGPEAWLQSGLLTPEVIQKIKPELQITGEQEFTMSSILTEARAKAEPVESKLKAEQQVLYDLLRQPETTAEAASAQLAKVLEAEGGIKHLQLRTLIALRNVLTPEQQKKALTLGAPEMATKTGTEAELMAKAEKLRAAVDGLGTGPTAAMKARGAEIEQLIKNGDLKAADSALNKLTEDSGLNAPEEKSAAPDFSKFSPGSTDTDTLKQRFEAVKDGAQNIVSLPLFRQFMKAKEAFEAAKSAEDAEAVGRILTWAEQALEKK